MRTVIRVFLVSRAAVGLAVLIPVPAGLAGLAAAMLLSAASWLALSAVGLRAALLRSRNLLRRNRRAAR